ncbi:hypothetical protein MMC15_004864 [Xylographa vitiligo]|nr:hypothetical protein [Xylographa vitiligo]
MAAESITDLAAIISENTAKVHNYYSSNGLTLPSFDVEAPTESLISTEAKEAQDARVAVIEATKKLRNYMLGPRDFLLSDFQHDELLSMQAVSTFKMALTFPVHEEASFEHIAKAVGLSESNTRRILRHAITRNLFLERRKGYVSHNAVSRLLAEDPEMCDWVAANSTECWPAAAHTLDALKKWPDSQEANETGFSIANDTDKSFYQVFGESPERAHRFGNAMKTFTKGTGYLVKHVVTGYPWASLGEGTIVDVGGSDGFISNEIALAYPKLKVIVEDLPQALDSVQVPSELADRISYKAHNFLTEEQPIKGADVYFYRWIFHNWSVKYCIQILRSVIPALKPGARIVFNDYVLPSPGDGMSVWQESRLRSLDLCMLSLFNAQERDLDDWAKLFEMADPRFKFLGGKQPEGAVMWILEAVWDPSTKEAADGA